MNREFVTASEYREWVEYIENVVQVHSMEGKVRECGTAIRYRGRNECIVI